MSVFAKNETVLVNEKPYNKVVILADVNVPYKLSIDRRKNKLFFCINADEFSDQSFQNVVLDLDSRSAKVVPSIRNGFASAVDQSSGSVYLGGSEGIYKYSYVKEDIDKPAIIKGMDIFDMYFKNYLYFVDTANLDLYVLKDNKAAMVRLMEEFGVNHFVIDDDENLIFANARDLFVLYKNSTYPSRFYNSIANIRGLTTDIHGTPYLVAENGIYSIDVQRKHLMPIISLENGYGLAFDLNNNIIYSEERTLVKLVPVT